MVSTSRTMIYLVLAVVALSGCAQDAPERHGPEKALGDAGSEPTGVATEGAVPPASGPRDEAPSNAGAANVTVHVYDFQGLVVGASMGYPNADTGGPIVDGVPPSRQDSFHVPEGATTLKHWLAKLDFGQPNLARVGVEIHAPDGSRVQTHLGAWFDPTGAPTCVVCGSYSSKEPLLAGEYTISYYVLGEVNLDASVTIEVSSEWDGDPLPKSFWGHVIAPDPTAQDTATSPCSGYGGAHELTHVATSQVFHFDQEYGGRSFGFDADGVVAKFLGVPSQPATSGIVPVGATGVHVCSVTAVDVDYRLTLTVA